jgi:hypothetical protein
MAGSVSARANAKASAVRAALLHELFFIDTTSINSTGLAHRNKAGRRPIVHPSFRPLALFVLIVAGERLPAAAPQKKDFIDKIRKLYFLFYFYIFKMFY